MPRAMYLYLLGTCGWLMACTTCMPAEARMGGASPAAVPVGIRDNPASFRSSYTNAVVWFDESSGSSGSYSGGSYSGGGYSFGK